MEQSKHIGRNQNTEATTHTELHTLKSRLHTAKKKTKKERIFNPDGSYPKQNNHNLNFFFDK